MTRHGHDKGRPLSGAAWQGSRSMRIQAGIRPLSDGTKWRSVVVRGERRTKNHKIKRPQADATLLPFRNLLARDGTEDGDAAMLGVDWVTVRCSGRAKPPHRTVRLRRWLSALTVFEQIGRVSRPHLAPASWVEPGCTGPRAWPDWMNPTLHTVDQLEHDVLLQYVEHDNVHSRLEPNDRVIMLPRTKSLVLTMCSSHDVEYEANTAGSLLGGWAAPTTNATMHAHVAVLLASLTTSDQSCTLAQPFSAGCKRRWQC